MNEWNKKTQEFDKKEQQLENRLAAAKNSKNESA
jgi:hypothetical protein